MCRLHSSYIGICINLCFTAALSLEVSHRDSGHDQSRLGAGSSGGHAQSFLPLTAVELNKRDYGNVHGAKIPLKAPSHSGASLLAWTGSHNKDGWHQRLTRNTTTMVLLGTLVLWVSMAVLLLVGPCCTVSARSKTPDSPAEAAPLEVTFDPIVKPANFQPRGPYDAAYLPSNSPLQPPTTIPRAELPALRSLGHQASPPYSPAEYEEYPSSNPPTYRSYAGVPSPPPTFRSSSDPPAFSASAEVVVPGSSGKWVWETESKEVAFPPSYPSIPSNPPSNPQLSPEFTTAPNTPQIVSTSPNFNNAPPPDSARLGVVPGSDEEAVTLLLRCRIITDEELEANCISREHLSECMGVARHMLLLKTLEEWEVKAQFGREALQATIHAAFTAEAEEGARAAALEAQEQERQQAYLEAEEQAIAALAADAAAFEHQEQDRLQAFAILEAQEKERQLSFGAFEAQEKERQQVAFDAQARQRQQAPSVQWMPPSVPASKESLPMPSSKVSRTVSLGSTVSFGHDDEPPGSVPVAVYIPRGAVPDTSPVPTLNCQTTQQSNLEATPVTSGSDLDYSVREVPQVQAHHMTPQFADDEDEAGAFASVFSSASTPPGGVSQISSPQDSQKAPQSPPEASKWESHEASTSSMPPLTLHPAASSSSALPPTAGRAANPAGSPTLRQFKLQALETMNTAPRGWASQPMPARGSSSPYVEPGSWRLAAQEVMVASPRVQETYPSNYSQASKTNM